MYKPSVPGEFSKYILSEKTKILSNRVQQFKVSNIFILVPISKLLLFALIVFILFHFIFHNCLFVSLLISLFVFYYCFCLLVSFFFSLSLFINFFCLVFIYLTFCFSFYLALNFFIIRIIKMFRSFKTSPGSKFYLLYRMLAIRVI